MKEANTGIRTAVDELIERILNADAEELQRISEAIETISKMTSAKAHKEMEMLTMEAAAWDGLKCYVDYKIAEKTGADVEH